MTSTTVMTVASSTTGGSGLATALIGFAGVAAGSIIAGIVGFLTVRSSERQTTQRLEHERQLAEVERSARSEEARRAFQRDTLLELQEVLQRRVRAAGRMHYEDVSALRNLKTARYGEQRVTEDVDRESFDTTVRLNALKVRVSDDVIRNRAGLVQEAAIRIETARSEDQADQHVQALGVAWEQANDRIGECLRATDDD